MSTPARSVDMNHRLSRGTQRPSDLILDGRWSAPIVIGGTGGSGTRLVARLLRRMGVELGGNVNAAEDALPFVSIYDRYISAHLRGATIDLKRFEAELFEAIRGHVDPEGKAAWGWKNPRSILLLPVLDSVVPGLRFVHVIRHGLDMAVSSNQNQTLLYAPAVLGPACEDLPMEVRSALLWKRVNETAADYGRLRMSGRYFLLRYEDVCADPAGSLAPVAAALGLTTPADGWNEPIALAVHRWTSLDPALLTELRTRIGDALERFGYTC